MNAYRGSEVPEEDDPRMRNWLEELYSDKKFFDKSLGKISTSVSGLCSDLIWTLCFVNRLYQLSASIHLRIHLYEPEMSMNFFKLRVWVRHITPCRYDPHADDCEITLKWTGFMNTMRPLLLCVWSFCHRFFLMFSFLLFVVHFYYKLSWKELGWYAQRTRNFTCKRNADLSICTVLLNAHSSVR